MGRRKRERRRSADRYAHLKAPQAVLDFHVGRPLTSSEIHRRTLAFVDDARRRGLERLRIVAGKGIHSADGPRAAPQVARTLRRLEEAGTIRSFGPEKLSEGGSGAFRVTL